MSIEPVYLDVARWMKEQREKHGLSQSQLSLLLGFSRPNYHLIERGKQRIHLHTYEAIRTLLDDDKIEHTKAVLAELTKPKKEQPLLKIEEPPNGKIEWDAEKVGALLKPEYEAGATVNDLSDKYGFPRRHIEYALVVAGTELSSDKPASNFHRDGEIVRLYVAGKSPNELATAFNLHPERVRQIVRRAGVSRSTVQRKPAKLTSEENQILADLKNGMTPQDVSVKYDYNLRRIYRLRQRAKANA